MLFQKLIDRIFHYWGWEKDTRAENPFREEDLHFVEKVNRQGKAAWRIHKYTSKRGKTIYTIDSN